VTWPMARVLRRIEGADVGLATLHEVIGELAIEVLVRVGREGERGATTRRPGQFRPLLQQFVEQPAVMRRNVLHVGQVLVAAFDLEAADTRIHQGGQVRALVVVLHRQHMLVVRDEAALTVGDLVGQAAGLRAVALGAAARAAMSQYGGWRGGTSSVCGAGGGLALHTENVPTQIGCVVVSWPEKR